MCIREDVWFCQGEKWNDGDDNDIIVESKKHDYDWLDCKIATKL